MRRGKKSAKEIYRKVSKMFGAMAENPKSKCMANALYRTLKKKGKTVYKVYRAVVEVIHKGYGKSPITLRFHNDPDAGFGRGYTDVIIHGARNGVQSIGISFGKEHFEVLYPLMEEQRLSKAIDYLDSLLCLNWIREKDTLRSDGLDKELDKERKELKRRLIKFTQKYCSKKIR